MSHDDEAIGAYGLLITLFNKIICPYILTLNNLDDKSSQNQNMFTRDATEHRTFKLSQTEYQIRC